MDSTKGDDPENKEQDRYLPIANIGRIMKQALPRDAKIAKEARETVQECVSEFISFITSEACDKCKNDKRKTINGDDLVYSLYQLGFERYLENLNTYYQKYKQAQKQNDKEQSSRNNEQLVNSAQEAVQQSKFSGGSGNAGGTNNNGLGKKDGDEEGEEDDIDEEEEDDDEMEDEEEEVDDGGGEDADMDDPENSNSKNVGKKTGNKKASKK